MLQVLRACEALQDQQVLQDHRVRRAIPEVLLEKLVVLVLLVFKVLQVTLDQRVLLVWALQVLQDLLDLQVLKEQQVKLDYRAPQETQVLLDLQAVKALLELKETRALQEHRVLLDSKDQLVVQAHRAIKVPQVVVQQVPQVSKDHKVISDQLALQVIKDHKDLLVQLDLQALREQQAPKVLRV